MLIHLPFVYSDQQQHVLQPSRVLPISFQPVFTDGWAPTITEPELMGFTSSSENSEIEDESIPISVHVVRDETAHTPMRRTHGHGVQDPDSSDADDLIHTHHIITNPNINSRTGHQNSSNNKNGHHLSNSGTRMSSSPSPIESLERDSPTPGHQHHPHIPTHQANDIEQVEWLADLHARNAKIVKVLFPRSANNEKELTVVR